MTNPFPTRSEWYEEAVLDLHAVIAGYPIRPCPWQTWEESVRESIRIVLGTAGYVRLDPKEHQAALEESFPQSFGLYGDY